MNEAKQRTLAMLGKHHGDGAAFAAAMKEAGAQRFDDAFWTMWEERLGPVLGERPTIVDLGAGPAILAHALATRYPGAEIVAVECAPYMIAAADPLPPGCRYVEEDLHDPHLPLADGSVDAVFTSMVLHEMTQPVKALREVHRCLKPGGRLLVGEVGGERHPRPVQHQQPPARALDPASDAETLDELFTHFIEHNRFSREDLGWLLESLGFEVTENAPLKGGAQVRLVGVKRA